MLLKLSRCKSAPNTTNAFPLSIYSGWPISTYQSARSGLKITLVPILVLFRHLMCISHIPKVNFQRKLQEELKDIHNDIDKYVVCVLETPDPFSNIAGKKYVNFPSPLQNRKTFNNKYFSFSPPSSF